MEFKFPAETERDYSGCALGSTSTGFYCGGSSTSYPGRFRVANIGAPGSTSQTMDASGNVIPFTNQFYNYGPLNYYQRPQERYQANFMAHYDVTDSAQVYTEFMFMDNSTVAQIALDRLEEQTGEIPLDQEMALPEPDPETYNAVPAGRLERYIGAVAGLVIAAVVLTVLGFAWSLSK